MASLTVTALSLTPSTLKRMLSEVRVERYSERLGPDRFNLTEVIAHIADLDDIFLDRMRQAQEYPGSQTPAFDPEQRSVEHHYADKDINHELIVFENRRRDLAEFLTDLPEEDWSKHVIHPRGGSMSIEQLANFVLAHDLFHLEQVSHYMS
jgi:uncharacterized damage-inducible protein DinB